MANILFLFVNLYLILPLKGELTFSNPYKSNKTSNPINYKIILSGRVEFLHETDLIPLVQGTNLQSVLPQSQSWTQSYAELSTPISYNILEHYDKLIHESYVLSPNFFAFEDNSNFIYLILGKKLYKINTNDNPVHPTQVELEINSPFLFIDYIIGTKQSFPNQKETIIYGMENETLFFYYIDSKNLIYSELKDIDAYISCKLILNNSFICIYSEIDEIKLSILNNTNDNHMETLHTYNDSSNNFFKEINEPIIYDTDFHNLKILCGRRKDNINSIKCILANLTFIQKNDGNEDFEIKFDNISGINATFSFKENNCNYAMFNSEFIFCCGNKDVVI